MLETNDGQPAAADDAVQPSETVEQVDGQSPGASDTPEQVAETDEQKNARILQEQETRQQRKRDAVQRRFDEMTARDKAKDRQIEQLLGVLQAREQPQAQQAPADAAPVRKDGEDYADFLKREARWEAKQEAAATVRAVLERQQQGDRARSLVSQAEQIRTQFADRMGEFAKSKPDWQTVVAENDEVDLPSGAIGLIHMDEEGPALLYAIGQNPKLATELQRAAQADGNGPPLRQSRVLGRIAASLSKSSAQVSNAPPPGQPVGSRAPTTNTPSDNDSMDAWLRKRNAQLKAR